MVDNLRRGDTVVTAGGIVGKVVKARPRPKIRKSWSRSPTMCRCKVLKATLSEVRAKNAAGRSKAEPMLQVSLWTRILVALIVLGRHSGRAAQCAARPGARAQYSRLAAAQHGQPGPRSSGRFLSAARSRFRSGAEGRREVDDRRYPRRLRKARIHYHRSRRQWRHGVGAHPRCRRTSTRRARSWTASIPP